jgi:hypothetical protein
VLLCSSPGRWSWRLSPFNPAQNIPAPVQDGLMIASPTK